MAEFGSRAKRDLGVQYTDEYLKKNALTPIPTAEDKTAAQQYAGIRQYGLTDYYRDKSTGSDAGTLGVSSLVAAPSYLPAAEEAAKSGAGIASTGSTGSGKAGSYTVNAGNQPYVDQLNSLYNQIVNRKPFQYDLNGDLLYRQMADQYTQLGQQAMMDTMGQAAGLTGGYGNSYAQSVGNQAYQQYLTALNEQIPNLYDRAYNVWQGDGDRLMQLYELAAQHPGILDSISPKTYTAATEEDGPLSVSDYLPLLMATGVGRSSAGSTATGYDYTDYLKKVLGYTNR